MKAGYSKIRNEALASAFSYMNLIEHWGSGIPRIIDKVREADLREPEFIGGETDLRINIYRRQAYLQSSDSLSHGVNGSHLTDKLPQTDIDCRQAADKLPITEQEKQIHKYTMEQGSITTAQAAILLGVKDRRARDILGKMVDKKWLKKEGAYRSTIYIINTERK